MSLTALGPTPTVQSTFGPDLQEPEHRRPIRGIVFDATSAVIAATTGQLFLIASYTVIGFLILGLAAAFGTHKDRGAPNV